MEQRHMTAPERVALVRSICKERGISIEERPGKVVLSGQDIYIVCSDLRDVKLSDLKVG